MTPSSVSASKVQQLLFTGYFTSSPVESLVGMAPSPCGESSWLKIHWKDFVSRTGCNGLAKQDIFFSKQFTSIPRTVDVSLSTARQVISITNNATYVRRVRENG